MHIGYGQPTVGYQKWAHLDFAGGTVVHINSGIAALVTALMIGKRKIIKKGMVSEPHNIPHVVIGAGLIVVWLVWIQCR